MVRVWSLGRVGFDDLHGHPYLWGESHGFLWDLFLKHIVTILWELRCSSSRQPKSNSLDQFGMFGYFILDVPVQEDHEAAFDTREVCPP